MNEKQGKYQRYAVKDAIEENALKPVENGEFKEDKSSSQHIITYTTGKHKHTIILSYNPFTLLFKIDDNTVMTVNGEQLFSFEQYRDRNPRPSSQQQLSIQQPLQPLRQDGQTDDDYQKLLDQYNKDLELYQQQQQQQNNNNNPILPDDQLMYPYDIDNMWEESFGGHTDIKKRGPSAIGLDINFINTQYIYGIPEHASSFALKNTRGHKHGDYNEPYRLYNLDVFEYELNEPMALYGSIPLIIAHTQDGKYTTGVLWVNAAETFVDITDNNNSNSGSGVLSSLFGSSIHHTTPKKNVHWMSETGRMDIFFILGPTPQEFYYQYTILTGKPFMPPQFSIAYHQCRWNYKSTDDVYNVDNGFDEYDIPYDTLWLDIEHTDSKKYFTWDRNNFIGSKQMLENLEKKGRHMVVIIDPHVKRDNGYFLHNAATSLGHYVKNNNGNDYEGWCWPGSSSYLDFFQSKVREFWHTYFTYDKYEGSYNNLHVWNDMNEPSVFNGPEVTMPKDNLHMIGNDNNGIEHREIHNQYGYYNHRATYEGLLKRDNNKQRPFVLTRSFFIGSQKYAAVWTGDNKADWSHLYASTPMLLSLSISQIPFSGADIGGFFGDPSIELLLRWYQVGSFHPFMRAHAHIDTKRREPWLFGEPYTTYIRNAIRQRYAYLPYIYTLFYENHHTGFPIMRALWLEFPYDTNTFNMEDEFLLGGNLLIKPITTPDIQTTIVYLPSNPNTQQYWYDLNNDAKHIGGNSINVLTPLSSIPIFQRGGSIIPKRERARRSSPLMIYDPYTLVIALDDKGNAIGHIYIDDNNSYDYLDGAFIYRTFKFHDNILSSHNDIPHASYTDNNIIERIVIYGAPSYKSASVISGTNKDNEALSNINLQITSFSNGKRLVIKKPDVRINSDFTIKFDV